MLPGRRQSLTSSFYLPPDLEYSYASVRLQESTIKPFNFNFLGILIGIQFFKLNLTWTWDWSFEISKLPFHDKFFAGGDRTVRGFDSNSLGPLRNNTTCTAKTCDAIGGDFLAVIQSNWIFPLHHF